MKISVAMAAYNGEKYIVEQLESILSQSKSPQEIIISDDSPGDNTRIAISRLMEENPAVIRYYKNESTLGVSKNFEQAISLCSGDVILLSDQDDIWEPNKIESLVALITASSSPVGAFCNSFLVDSNLNPSGLTHWDLRGFTADLRRKYIGADKTEKVELFCKRVPAAGHNMAFSAKFKEQLLPFPDLPECHDTWIGLSIAVTGGWAFVGDSLTLFRQHENNVSNSGRRSQFQEALYSIKHNTFEWNAKLYHALIERLESGRPPVEDTIINMLKDRYEHSVARARMNCNILKRLPLILKEVINGRYFKFARGWKSIFQDVFLRIIA